MQTPDAVERADQPDWAGTPDLSSPDALGARDAGLPGPLDQPPSARRTPTTAADPAACLLYTSPSPRDS